MDDSTCREIDKLVAKTLKEAGLTDPPIEIDHLLEHLEVHRDYYDLS